MKKRLITLGIGILFFSWIGFAETNSVDTFRWAYEEGIRTFDKHLLGRDHLRRQEIAPFLLNYISKVAKKEYTAYECKAKDLQQADEKYRADLETLCRYGIIRGEKDYLLPQSYLTNAQAITLIMRIVDGYQQEAYGNLHWAEPYFKKAKALGYEGITPIYYRKNFPMTLENLINFLYSIEHPNEAIHGIENTPENTFDTNAGSDFMFNSSDDALRKLAEIMSR